VIKKFKLKGGMVWAKVLCHANFGREKNSFHRFFCNMCLSDKTKLEALMEGLYRGCLDKNGFNIFLKGGGPG
jgi:hypothetical protein